MMELNFQPFKKSTDFKYIISPVFGEQVSEKKDKIVNWKDYTGEIVYCHGSTEFHGYCGIWILNTQAWYDQNKANKGIENMPESYPDRIKV